MAKTIDHIPKEFKVNLQGKDHVTYDGLLDLAHQNGLMGVETELLQAPTDANKGTAIAFARVVFLVDGQNKTFTGIGDANSTNVNRNIGLHIIRMAETRAKARALRDALNIKGCAFEELGGDLGDHHDERPRQAAPAPGGNTTEFKASPNKPASDKQLGKIRAELKRVGWTGDDAKEFISTKYGRESSAEMSSADASAMIEHLVALPDAEAV